jgi:hypothetical protein
MLQGASYLAAVTHVYTDDGSHPVPKTESRKQQLSNDDTAIKMTILW